MHSDQECNDKYCNEDSLQFIDIYVCIFLKFGILEFHLLNCDYLLLFSL